MENVFIADIGTSCIKYGTTRRARRNGGFNPSSQTQTAQVSWNAAVASNGISGAFSIVDEMMVSTTADFHVGPAAQHLAALLGGQMSTDYTLFLLVHPLTPSRTKELLVRSAFEELAAKKVMLSYSATAAILGQGFTHGVVVDVGYRATTITPIVNAVPVFSLVEHITGQGAHSIDVRLSTMLERSGGGFPSAQTLMAAHHHTFLHRLKMDNCSLHGAARGETSASPTTLKLPDDAEIRANLSSEDYMWCTQGLTDGQSLLYSTQHVIRHALRLHIAQSPWILIGGPASIRGLDTYFTEGLVNKNLFFKRDVFHQPVKDSMSAAWNGALIMSQLSSFGGMCIERDVYEDCGPRETLRFNMSDSR